MPLKRGNSPATISGNIRELYHANQGRPKPRKRNQIIAIAESEARRTGGGMGKIKALPMKRGK